VAYVLPFSLTIWLNECFMRFIIIGAIGLVISVAAIYLIGLSKDERQFFLELIENRLKSIFKSDQLK
jgi:hypothetical protein